MANSKTYRAESFKRNIRVNLRKKLNEKGWTNGHLARETGVTTGMVGKWLMGEASPSWGGLAKICTAFGEGPEYFLIKHEKEGIV